MSDPITLLAESSALHVKKNDEIDSLRAKIEQLNKNAAIDNDVINGACANLNESLAEIRDYRDAGQEKNNGRRIYR